MSVTLGEARSIAEKLKQNNPQVLAVLLFGSVLKTGVGRDADFVIGTTEEIAREWWGAWANSIRVQWPDAFYGQRWIMKRFFPFVYGATVRKKRQQRLLAAAKLLNIDLSKLTDSAGQQYDIELFLLPENWRLDRVLNLDAMGNVTNLINHRNTRGFLERIARESVRLD